MAVDEQALTRSLDSLAAALAELDGPRVSSVSAYLTATVSAAAELLDVEYVGILLLDDAGRLRAVASSGALAAAVELAQQQLGVGPGPDTVAEGRTVAVSDLTDIAEYAPLTATVGPLGLRAVLSAPITVEGDVTGNLNLMRTDTHHWTQAEAQAAEAFAGVVAELLATGSRPLADAVPNGRWPQPAGTEE